MLPLQAALESAFTPVPPLCVVSFLLPMTPALLCSVSGGICCSALRAIPPNKAKCKSKCLWLQWSRQKYVWGTITSISGRILHGLKSLFHVWNHVRIRRVLFSYYCYCPNLFLTVFVHSIFISFSSPSRPLSPLNAMKWCLYGLNQNLYLFPFFFYYRRVSVLQGDLHPRGLRAALQI